MLNRLQDVFRSFQQHDVRYVVIGGIAVVLHGVPRATFDLDSRLRGNDQSPPCHPPLVIPPPLVIRAPSCHTASPCHTGSR